jgi:hypothetical protein
MPVAMRACASAPKTKIPPLGGILKTYDLRFMLELKHEPFFSACQAPYVIFLRCLCYGQDNKRKKNYALESNTYAKKYVVVICRRNTQILERICKRGQDHAPRIPQKLPSKNPHTFPTHNNNILLLLIYILYYTISIQRDPLGDLFK